MPALLSDSTAPRWRARLRDGARKVAEHLATPLVPADYLDVFDPLRKGADLRGRVVSVTPETRDAATLEILPGKDWAGHVPGQYVRIGIDVDGVRQWRAYSLTHGPRRDGLISITVKAVPDGLVSNHVVHDLTPGVLVHLEQAAGEFVLPVPADEEAPAEPTKVLFVTAGSGITPVIGMLRNLYPVAESGPVLPERSDAYDITVVHVAPSRPHSIFLRNLEALHDAGAIRLVARYDDEHGVLDVADLTTLVPDLAERTTYACGPAGLLDALQQHHDTHGLALQTEQFRVATLVTGEGGNVTLTGAGISFDAAGDRPILEQAEEAGALMPSGCRMGVCFGCVLPLREGVVRDLRSGDITTAVEGDGVKIQTCINAAAGPCRIDN
ncbi:ferredoxin reductase [Nocardioides aequoreus]|uniref:ferredoxin reductase n=1 Tax=Nocardioides aequoreus TaxID=397278 RepID=UPI0004C4205E|nr:ferredoxin reductase [Nocardioides aequoreus]